MRIDNLYIGSQKVRVWSQLTLKEQFTIGLCRELRTLSIGREQYVWEAYLATHFQVAEALGISLSRAKLGNA